MKRFIAPLLLALPAFATFPDICVKCWYEVPNSVLDSVFQSPRPPGWGGENAIMSENGGAYDSRRNRLIVMGGGGSSYAGNEVYAFSLDSLKWERIKDAATYFDDSDSISGYYFNGGAVPDSQQPRPAYNFDQIEYDSTTDNVFIFGQSFASWNGTTWPNILQLNLGSLTWHQPGTFNSEFHGGNVSARHPGTGKIWFYGNGGWMSEFDPSAGTVTDHGDIWNSNWINTNQNAAIMPPKDRMISIGAGQALYWDVATSGNSPPNDLAVTGCDSLMAVDAPGFEWSPADNKMVGWAGGGRVVTMDTSYTCTVEEPSDSNTVMPEDPELYGTYGRWRYVPKYNVFVVVSTETGKVYLYRHSAGTGSGGGTPPLVRVTSPVDHKGFTSSPITVAWTVNGITQSTQTSESLVEGTNKVKRTFTDGSGTGADSIVVILDTHGPAVHITSPANNTYTNQASASVAWTVDDVAQAAQLTEALSVGSNKVIRSATDSLGNVGKDSITIIRDTTSPIVIITVPGQDTAITGTSFNVHYTVDGAPLQKSFTLGEGDNQIIVDTTDLAGNHGRDTVHIYSEPSTPHLSILAPTNGYISSSTSVFFDVQKVSGFVQTLHLLIDGTEKSSFFTSASGHYTATLATPTGHHTFIAYASNVSGTSDTLRAAFNVDTIPPQTQITITGAVVDANTLNGIPGVNVKVRETASQVTTGSDGKFSLPSGGFGKFKVDITKSGYTSAIRFVPADSGLNISLPTITLVPIDTHTVRVPSGKDTTISLSSSKVQMDFPNGAIGSPLSVSATVFNHISQLPNEQPNQEIFLFGVDLQPEGTVFSESLTVRVANQNQLTAGADVPITYFNKSSGQWDNVGTGYVTSDGRYIQFKTTHFSTFHGNSHYASGANTPGDEAGGAPPDPPTCPVGSSTASFVSLPSGDLQLDYAIPGGPALTDLDVKLIYWSSAANPRKIISSQLDSVKLTPAYLSWTLFMPGSRKQWVFYGPSQPSVLNYVWPGRDADGKLLETGLYTYGIRFIDVLPVGSYRYDVSRPENLYYRLTTPANVTNYFYGYTTLVNRTQSPYGAGWAIDGITRIVAKKNNLTQTFPSQASFRALNSIVRTSEPNGDSAVSRVGVSTALNAVSGDLPDDHVSIVGAGPDGQIFWRVHGTNRYLPSFGSHDSLTSTDSGWTCKRINGILEEYNNAGLLTRRTDNKGHRQQFSYDVFGERLLSVTDVATGAKVELLYDARDKLSGIKDQFGRVTQIQVNAENNLTTIQSPDGITQRAISYDTTHRAIRKDLPGGAFSTYSYDSWGGVLQTKSPEGLITDFKTRSVYGVVNELQPADDDVLEEFLGTTFTAAFKTFAEQPIHPIPNATAEKKSFSDNLGESHEYTYNTFGLVEKETNAKGEQTHYEYTPGCGCGQASEIHYPNGLTISNVRDPRGNLLQTQNSFTGATTAFEYVTIRNRDYVSKATNALGQETHYTYDTLGNLIGIIVPGNDTTRITYNALSLPIGVTDPAGRTSRTGYDSLGRVTVNISPKGDTTSYSYDSYGNLNSVKDPLGRVTTFTNDAVGRLLQTRDAAGNLIRYHYDTFGRLDSLIDPNGHATRYAYDSAGRMIQTTNQAGVSRFYAYDNHGDLTRYTNGRGQSLTYEYDVLERLVAKINPDSSVRARFGYDEMGNMVYAATPAYAVNRRFDLAGRMLQESLGKVKSSDTVTANDTILADDFSRDYTRLVVNGGTVVIDGEHHFKTLKLLNGSRVRHLPADTVVTHRLSLFVQDSVIIDSSSSIDLIGLGYLGGQRGGNASNLGRTEGNSTVNGSSPGSGGSHGGKGGIFSFKGNAIGFAAPIFDDRLNPVLPGGGAGGAAAAAANGGGVLLLSSPLIVLNGVISVRGENYLDDKGGAGAGGTINIFSDSLKGSGNMDAAGGNGQLGDESPEGGGGGRIFVKSNFFGEIDFSARGGTHGGQSGTVVLIGPGSAVVDVLLAGELDTLKSGDSRLEGSNLVLNGASMVIEGTHQFHSLTLKNHAFMTHSSANTSEEEGVDLKVDAFVKIDSTSRIDASEKGYRAGTQFLCALKQNFQCGSEQSSGGSYGGLGGESGGFSGAPYGSLIEPTDFGSGGSTREKSKAFYAGNGGGRISISTSDFLLDGQIAVNGGIGSHGGGGSGGSVLIAADSLHGVGSIFAQGGMSLLGGGGSGGRIALSVRGRAFSENRVWATGGVGATPGANGTIYLSDVDSLLERGFPAAGSPIVISNDSLVIDERNRSFENKDILVTNGKVSVSGFHTFGHVSLTDSRAELTGQVFIADSLSLHDSSSLFHKGTTLETEYGLALLVNGNVSIDSSSKADVSGQGYWGDRYLDSNFTNARTHGNKPSGTTASGGGYGGLGAVSDNLSTTNPTYGDAFFPIDLGSGGGTSESYTGLIGGNGGGCVRIWAKNIQANGRISADGTSGVGSYASYISAAGGSGGSILLSADSLIGSGRIHANGGNGQGGYPAGGGGGRVALYPRLYFGLDENKIEAVGTFGGHRGTVVVAKCFGNPDSTLVMVNPDSVSNSDSVTAFIQAGDSSFDGYVIRLKGNGLGVLGDHYFKKVITENSNLHFQGHFTLDTMSLSKTLAELGDSISVGGDIRVENTSIVSQPPTDLSTSHHVSLKAGRRIILDSTSRIDVSAKGYAGEGLTGTTWHTARTRGNLVGSVNGAGASHGGVGAPKVDNGTGAIPNPIYDDAFNPDDDGSGGAASQLYGTRGGNGGGLVRLFARSMVLNGKLLGNGGNGSGSVASYRCDGGGSGGGIYVSADTISGTGSMRANGGSGQGNYPFCGGDGGGGGGRVAVYATSSFTMSRDSVMALGSQDGGRGSVVINTGSPDSILYLTNPSGTDSSDRVSSFIFTDDHRYDGYSLVVNGNGLEIEGTHNFKKITALQSHLSFVGVNTVDTLDVDRCTLETSGYLTAGNGSFSQSQMTISGMLTSTYSLSFLHHTYAFTSNPSQFSRSSMSLNVGGLLTLDSTSSLDVTATGYLGSYFSTSWNLAQSKRDTASVNGAGGGYGGEGGAPDGTLSNKTYGNPLDPEDAGSGGSTSLNFSTRGGNGGGVMHIVSHKMILDGFIYANGGNGTGNNVSYYQAGGGSGGSIYLQADSLSGRGYIYANGGSGMHTDSYLQAGGGGGRIALVVTESNTFYTGSISAMGGDNGRPGSVTIQSATADSTLTYFNPVSDSNVSISSTIGTADSAFEGYSLNLDGGGVEILGTHHLKKITLRKSNLHLYGNVTVDTLIAQNSQIDMTGQLHTRYQSLSMSQAILSGSDISTGDILLSNHSFLSHSSATDSASYWMVLHSDARITLDSSSRIDVSGKGYEGDHYRSFNWSGGRTYGNVNGSSGGAGGGYGGNGGKASGTLNARYGNLYFPNELGSGGGVDRSSTGERGGNGGGYVRLEGHKIILNGEVSADGLDGMDPYSSSHAAGGGSGGGVLLQADSVEGTGYIHGIGGLGYGASGLNGGGGGRLAAQANHISPALQWLANGHNQGGAGTIFLKDLNRSHGLLIIDNDNQSAPDSSTVLPFVGQRQVTGMTSDTLKDSLATFSAFLRGHGVKLNYSTGSAGIYYTILSSTNKSLAVDTTTYILSHEGSVGDPYSGIYVLDTIEVVRGARAMTHDLMFYQDLHLDDGHLTTYIGTETGMLSPEIPDQGKGNQGRVRLGLYTQQLRKTGLWIFKLASGRVELDREQNKLLARVNLTLKRKNAAKNKGLVVDKHQYWRDQALIQANKKLDSVQDSRVRQIAEGIIADREKPAKFADSSIPLAITNVNHLSVALTSTSPHLVCPLGDPVYAYDFLDRRISMTTPAGTTQYQYDSTSGRLKNIIAPGNKIFGFNYSKGDLTSLSYPNGIVAHYLLDSNLNLTRLSYLKASDTVRTYAYAYNAKDMRTSMTDQDGVHNFTYDVVDQITQATHPRTVDPLEKFKYDSTGNRLHGLDTTFTWVYNGLNQVTETDSARYTYDADGNMILKVDKVTGDSTHYTFDIENHLVAMSKIGTVAGYGYDALNRRVHKDVNGSTKEFRYDGLNLKEEDNGNDSLLAAYTFGPGIDWPLEMVRGGLEFYYLRDGLGSVMALTSGSGTIVREYKYGAFGKMVGDSGSIENTFTYTGREREDELGMYFNRARYYDPGLGRWITRDPIEEDGGINLYGYVLNSPLTLVDHLGLAGGADDIEDDENEVEENEDGNLIPRLPFGAPGYEPPEPAGPPEPDPNFGFTSPPAQPAEEEEKCAEPNEETPKTRRPRARTRKNGPSDKPRIHIVRHPNKKSAKDAARNEGKGEPIHHPSPTRGWPHYHSTDENGDKLPNGVHHEYPPR